MGENELARWRTRHVGFVFQFYHLIPVLTAYENVELPLLLLSLSAERRREQVLTTLELVGLTHRLKHRPGQLSGGEQQRVGIARAVVNKPPLLLADEPTGNLDAALSEEIMDLFLDFNHHGVTVLIASHDQRLISRARRRVLELRQGELVRDTGAAT